MLVLIVVFIVLFFVDLWLGRTKQKLFTEAEITFGKMKKNNLPFYKKFNSLYGKEWDELRNKPLYGDFPFSLFTHFKDIERLDYLTERMKSELDFQS